MNNNNKALIPKLWDQLYSTIDLLGLVTQQKVTHIYVSQSPTC